MLCSSPPSKQHSGAFRHSLPECYRLPSNGGMENRLHVPLHSGPHGPSLQTSNYISNSFYGSGIYRFWPTKFHAIHHLSRWSSSNMQLFSTNYAITSRQSLTGPRHNRQYAVAKTGEPSKQQLSIHQTRIGSWQVPFFTPWSLKSSRS